MQLDIVDLSDLNCANCGSCELSGDCYFHGEMESGALRGTRVYCCEWNYEAGRECKRRLVVTCGNCGAVDTIEGLE